MVVETAVSQIGVIATEIAVPVVTVLPTIATALPVVKTCLRLGLGFRAGGGFRLGGGFCGFPLRGEERGGGGGGFRSGCFLFISDGVGVWGG